MDRMEIFDFDAAMEMVDNDTALMQILLDGFLKEAPFEEHHLFDLIAKNENEEAAHYVHRVKGAARQLAAKPLAAKGQELEDIFRGKTTGDASKVATEFCELYKQTYEVLEEEANKLQKL